MKLVKRAVRQSLAMDLDTHLDMVSSHMLLTRPSEDHAEAIKAYEEGRKPVEQRKSKAGITLDMATGTGVRSGVPYSTTKQCVQTVASTEGNN